MLRRLALMLSLCCAIVLAPSAALAATPSATEPPGFLCGLVPVLFCPEETSTPTPTPTHAETSEPEAPAAPSPIEPPQAAPVSPPSEESTHERNATEGGNLPPSSATRNGSTHAATSTPGSAPVTQPTSSPSTASPTQEPQTESVEIIAPPDDDSNSEEELAVASNRPSPIPWLAAVAALCFGVAIVLYRRLVAQTAASAVGSKPPGKHAAR